jgi:hypothetical protein
MHASPRHIKHERFLDNFSLFELNLPCRLETGALRQAPPPVLG